MEPLDIQANEEGTRARPAATNSGSRSTVAVVGGVLVLAVICTIFSFSQRSATPGETAGPTLAPLAPIIADVSTTTSTPPAISPQPSEPSGRVDFKYCGLPVRGLVNADGSSCFLNSAFQMLLAVPGLCQLVFRKTGTHLRNASRWSEGEKRWKNMLPGQHMLPPLLEGFARAYSYVPEDEAVSSGILDNLRATLSDAKLLERHRQEDSEEFLRRLMARFQAAAIDEASSSSMVSGYRLFSFDEQQPLDDGRSPGADVICEPPASTESSSRQCRTVGTLEDTFMIMLPVLGFSSDSLATMFAAEFLTEKVNDPENALLAYIDGKNYEFAEYETIREVIHPVPRSLMFSFKRFEMDWATMRSAKKSSDVHMPLELKHPACAESDESGDCAWRYHLEGFVVHLGHSADSGHYVAVVRGRGTDDERRKWYYISDSEVNEIGVNRVRQLANQCLYAAYVKMDSSDSPELPVNI